MAVDEEHSPQGPIMPFMNELPQELPPPADNKSSIIQSIVTDLASQVVEMKSIEERV